MKCTRVLILSVSDKLICLGWDIIFQQIYSTWSYRILKMDSALPIDMFSAGNFICVASVTLRRNDNLPAAEIHVSNDIYMVE